MVARRGQVALDDDRAEDGKVGDRAAEPPEGATWTKPPAIVDRLHYRQDRVGYTEPGFTHLFVVPADGGTPRPLTSGDWNVGARFDGMVGAAGIDWTADSRTIVVDGLDAPDSDLRYRDSDLFSIDVAAGTRRKLIAEGGSWSNPRVSPDGKLVAFVGHPSTRASYKTEELFVVSIDGSGMRKISAAMDRDAVNLHWAPDGQRRVFHRRRSRDVERALRAVVGIARLVTTGTHLLSLTSVSAKGAGVGVRSAANQPPDVVRVSLAQPGQIAQLTRVNEDLLHGLTLGEVEEITYASTGGARSRAGWSSRRRSIRRSKYPLIMEIHGGPHGDVQRRLQLHVPALRRQRLPRALYEPARQHRLRHRRSVTPSSGPIPAWTTTI